MDHGDVAMINGDERASGPDVSTKIEMIDAVLCLIAMTPQLALLFFLVDQHKISFLWDSDSYLIAARHFTGTFPYIPTLGFRIFGYPGLLRLFAYRLPDVIFVQKLLTLFSTALLYYLSRICIGSRAVAFGVALVFAVDVQLALYANSIMPECLAMTLQLMALTFFALYLRRPDTIAYLIAAAFILTLAIFVRPTIAIAVPVLIIAVFWTASHSHKTFKAITASALPRAALVMIVAVGPILAYATYNKLKVGYFKAFDAAGFSSLNYISSLCFYPHLSDRLAYLKEPLEDIQKQQFKSYDEKSFDANWCQGWFFPSRRPDQFNWGQTFDALRVAYQKKNGNSGEEWDSLALKISMTAIEDRPLVYLQLWSKNFADFWTSYGVVFGLYETVKDVHRQTSLAVDTLANDIVSDCATVFSYLSLASFIFIAAALTLPIGRFGHRDVKVQIIGLLAFYALVYSVQSTIFEPAPAQARYRAMIDPLVFLCAGALIDRACIAFLCLCKSCRKLVSL